MMEEDTKPVPQMLFINEAFLHSQVLEPYEPKTSEDYSVDFGLCTQTCEKSFELDRNEKDSLYDSSQTTNRLDSANNRIVSNHEDCAVTNDCSHIKVENGGDGLESSMSCPTKLEKELSQTPLIEVKTERYGGNMSYSTKSENELNQTPSVRIKIERDEDSIIFYSTNLENELNQKPLFEITIERDEEVDILLSSNVCPTTNMSKMSSEFFGCNQENLQDCDDISSGLIKHEAIEAEGYSDTGLKLETPTDCYEIKIERDEGVDIPFYTNVCPTTCVDEMSSEFLECKQKNLQNCGPDRDEATDVDENFDTAMDNQQQRPRSRQSSFFIRSCRSEKGLDEETPSDCFEIKLERDEEVGVPFNVCPTTSMDDRSSESLTCKQERLQDSGPNRGEEAKVVGEHSVCPSEDARGDVDVYEEIKRRQPYVVIKKLDLLSIEMICQALHRKVLEGNRLRKKESIPTDAISSFKTNRRLRRLSIDRGGLVQQQQQQQQQEQTINSSEDGIDKFSGSSHMRLAGEVLDKQETTERTPVRNETSSFVESHMRKGVGKKCYKCGVCNKGFGLNSELTAHMKKHNKVKKTHKCTVCDKEFISKSKLTIHMRIHSGEKAYKCKVCDADIMYKTNFTRHMRRHTGEKLHKCTVCEREFIDTFKLKQHMRIHSGEKPYKCTVCDRAFICNAILTIHMKTHTGKELEKPHKCNVCGKAFIYNCKLTIHMRIHTGEEPEKHIKCDFCEKAFHYKSKLTRHIRITHTGEKPYKCILCGKAFLDKSKLKRHLRRKITCKRYVNRKYRSEKPYEYECSVCCKTFCHNSKLIRHMRTHTGEKPFKCNVCDKAFVHKFQLIKHTRMHTGETNS